MTGVIHILTMVVMVSTTSQNRAMVTITAEYRSQESCQRAMQANREALSVGHVILATCTPK